MPDRDPPDSRHHFDTGVAGAHRTARPGPARRAVRRRPGPRRAVRDRGRRPAHRLLQERRRRRRARRPRRRGRTVAGVERRRAAMFAGEPINVTEHRAVLHTALRAPAGSVIELDGVNVVDEVHAVLDRMAAFADRIRADERITDIVNIGIGGSDLGPAMAARALAVLRPPAAHVSFRLQRRRRRHRRHARRSRPRIDAVRRVLQDVHDHRDPHERPHRSAVARRHPRRGGRRRPLRRRLDERRAGRRVRHRHRQHVRLLGLGRRPVLGGLGDRALVDAAHRTRRVPRVPRRVPHRRRALRRHAPRRQRSGAAGR